MGMGARLRHQAGAASMLAAQPASVWAHTACRGGRLSASPCPLPAPPARTAGTTVASLPHPGPPPHTHKHKYTPPHTPHPPLKARLVLDDRGVVHDVHMLNGHGGRLANHDAPQRVGHLRRQGSGAGGASSQLAGVWRGAAALAIPDALPGEPPGGRPAQQGKATGCGVRLLHRCAGVCVTC